MHAQMKTWPGNSNTWLYYILFSSITAETVVEYSATTVLIIRYNFRAQQSRFECVTCVTIMYWVCHHGSIYNYTLQCTYCVALCYKIFILSHVTYYAVIPYTYKYTACANRTGILFKIL